MPCYHPVPGWIASRKTDNGRYKVVFSPESGINERRQVEIPCGKCIGCRLEYARNWAVRCMHEAKLYQDNCFVTLTYDDKNVPKLVDGQMTLRPRDVVLFLKRLRISVSDKIRFFQAGEYGEKLLRPHHHMLLFNFVPPDRVYYKSTGRGDRLYTSKWLRDLWPYGECYIGEVSFESAGYVARYSLKKVYGDAASTHYNGRVPEYLTMSRRPGIGFDWAMRFRHEWYRDDSVIVNGSECKPPRYYDSLEERYSPGRLARVKASRVKAACASPDNAGSRLISREAVKQSALSTLNRRDCDS